MTTLYITLKKFYALAMPPGILFSTDADVPTPFLPGSISDVTQTVGAGVGKATIDLGQPIRHLQREVVCTTGGRINEQGVNPGGLPAFKLALMGSRLGAPRTVSANDDRAYIERDQRASERNGWRRYRSPHRRSAGAVCRRRYVRRHDDTRARSGLADSRQSATMQTGSLWAVGADLQ